jgi:biopolymer transport protein ExbD
MAELDTSSQGKGKKGKKKHRGGKKASTRVDLTPMVDLGFLLVTFFMLTTTFIKPNTMEINMPVKPKEQQVDQKNQEVKASKALTILIGADNKVYWFMGVLDPSNKPTLTDFSKDGIRKVLLEKNAQIKDMVVLIKPSDDANYKNAVDILDEMLICNIKRYAIVDITSDDLKAIKNL